MSRLQVSNFLTRVSHSAIVHHPGAPTRAVRPRLIGSWMPKHCAILSLEDIRPPAALGSNEPEPSRMRSSPSHRFCSATGGLRTTNPSLISTPRRRPEWARHSGMCTPAPALGSLGFTPSETSRRHGRDRLRKTLTAQSRSGKCGVDAKTVTRASKPSLPIAVRTQCRLDGPKCLEIRCTSGGNQGAH
jgi:hypothetical protein